MRRFLASRGCRPPAGADAQPDSPFDPDGPPLEAGADDATCSDDDAGDADVLDAGGEDASDAGIPTDAGGEEYDGAPFDAATDASDAASSDAGGDADAAPAPWSDVTCTFTREVADVPECAYCDVPPAQTITVDHVPIFIDHASWGYEGQIPLAPPPRRVIHIDASSAFDAWGVRNAFLLSGTPPNESWVNEIRVVIGTFGGTIKVESGNATTVSLSGAQRPGTGDCIVLRGCFHRKARLLGHGRR